MAEKEVVIFKGRIQIEKNKLIEILENIQISSGSLPSGLYFDWQRDGYGIKSRGITIPPEFTDNGIVIHIFWEGDKQIIRGESRQHGLRQFNIGKVEIRNANSKDFNDDLFDVSVISEWSPLRAYCEKIAEKLKPFTKKAKVKTYSIESIKYKGSVSEFRAWMDMYLARGGGNLSIPLPRDVQIELMKHTMQNNNSDIISFPNMVININYSLQDKDTNREVWYVYLYDPRISESRAGFVSIHKWATILAVENPPNNTTVEFLDGVLFRRVRNTGEIENYVRGNPIGDHFSGYIEFIKKQWLESRVDVTSEKKKSKQKNIKEINLQTKPAGRKIESWNPRAYDILHSGEDKAEIKAFNLWCDAKGIKNPQKGDREAFKKAMQREEKRRGRNR